MKLRTKIHICVQTGADGTVSDSVMIRRQFQALNTKQRRSRSTCEAEVTSGSTSHRSSSSVWIFWRREQSRVKSKRSPLTVLMNSLLLIGIIVWKCCPLQTVLQPRLSQRTPWFCVIWSTAAPYRRPIRKVSDSLLYFACKNHKSIPVNVWMFFAVMKIKWKTYFLEFAALFLQRTLEEGHPDLVLKWGENILQFLFRSFLKTDISVPVYC